VPELGLTVDQAIANYLIEVEATKDEKTYRQYRRELEWFRTHCKKRYVAQLNRSALFAQGRREVLDDKPLNQKTTNRASLLCSTPCAAVGETALFATSGVER
jgi:hypothetical protein